MIIDPFAVSPRFDQAGESKIGKMARYLWLALLKFVAKVSDRNLAGTHQAQKPKPCAVRKDQKEFFQLRKGSIAHN
jgi:hypothetical protein